MKTHFGFTWSFNLDPPPPQDSSHYQEKRAFFSRKSQPKPSFATGMLGWGGRSNLQQDKKLARQDTLCRFNKTRYSWNSPPFLRWFETAGPRSSRLGKRYSRYSGGVDGEKQKRWKKQLVSRKRSWLNLIKGVNSAWIYGASLWLDYSHWYWLLSVSMYAIPIHLP